MSTSKITDYTTPSDLYSKGVDKRKNDRQQKQQSSLGHPQETTLNKVLSQHAVHPDPDLLQRVAPDKKLMNGKGSPAVAKDTMKRTNSKI